MLDSHCHLNLDPLVDNFKTYLEEANQNGIEKILIPGVNFESSQIGVKIANENLGVFAGVGLHPHEAEQLLTTKPTTEIYNWLLETANNKKVMAIGECGLDYFRLPEDPLEQKHAKAAQKKLFKLHIKASLTLNKPLLVHVREANDDAILMLETYKPKAVLHCYSGDENYLKKALDLGLYISFAGNITFSNAKNLQDQIKLIPIEKLLLETDAPFLNPQRGQWPNTPSQIKKTYEFVADFLGISLNALTKQIDLNFSALFNSNEIN